MNSGKTLAPAQQKRILKELRTLYRAPLEDVRLHASEESIEQIRATIVGPKDTPFESGEFQLRIEFGSDFPNAPPKGYFITRIFHPNVDPQSGAICVNTLKRDWDPKYGLQHILVAIRSLLIVPNHDSALNEEAGKLLLDSYAEFARRAKIFTKIHASVVSNKSLRRNDSQSSIECDENEERSSNISPHNDSHSKRKKRHKNRHKNESESKTGDDDDSNNNDDNAEVITSTTSASSKSRSHKHKHSSSSSTSMSSKKKHSKKKKKNHSSHSSHNNSKVKASLRRL